MIIATTETIAGRRIARTLGLVRGSAIRGRHLGKDLVAHLRNAVGGEIPEYTKMMSESREQALDRMIEEARELGADAVVGLRFATSSMMAGAAEILVYGTAVVTEADS
ncbi:MAG: YbjQ family protein [Acidobacteria bacterium]|nr:MAG: YbjQ family protein [Acidobacteriota bacterium]